MPLVHTQDFQVRYYECDAYGHLNHANYLRYMQESAFDASAAAGYDLERYTEMGFHWVTHRTLVSYIRPLLYGDRIQIKTWMDDHRRARSRRCYEFRLAGSGELTTRAETDWIYRNDSTGRPAQIPRELLASFFPEGVPPMAGPRRPFPEPPPPPPGVYRIQRQVEWREIDTMRHVNNAAYLAYVEDCGFRVAQAFGWPVERMWDAGFAVIAREHDIEYRQPALLGDKLEIATWIARFKHASAVRYFTISRVSDGALLARIRTLWAWVDIHSGLPIRIPEDFARDFQANLSPG